MHIRRLAGWLAASVSRPVTSLTKAPNDGLEVRKEGLWKRPRAMVPLILFMLAFSGVSALSALRPSGLGAVAMWQMRSASAIISTLARIVAGLSLQVFLFAVPSAIAPLLLRDQGSQRHRFRASLIAYAISCAVAVTALWMRSQTGVGVAASDFATAPLGVALGVSTTLRARQGWRQLALFGAKLAAAFALGAILCVSTFLAVLQREPTLDLPVAIRTQDKRQVVAHLRGSDPRKIPAGELHTLRLNQTDVDHILAWGTPLVDRAGHFRAAVSLYANEGFAVQTSGHLPLLRKWLNVAASVDAGVQAGELYIDVKSVQVGPVHLPRVLVAPLGRALALALRSDRRLQTIFAGIEKARIENGSAVVQYRHMDLPQKMTASLVWGEEGVAAMRISIEAQVQAIEDALASLPPGDGRFARAYETAFTLARARAVQSSSVQENRVAILALAIVLGSTRIAMLTAANQFDDDKHLRIAQLRSGTTVRGRADWTRHFSISSALTAASAVDPANAAGLLKEELDADGGSGFSFGDLLADRAGTTFGEVATRDEKSAAALQDRLAGGFDVDAFFPPAADLPEDIPDAALQSRYGGVGGPLYRKYADEIERRVASCLGYR